MLLRRDPVAAADRGRAALDFDAPPASVRASTARPRPRPRRWRHIDTLARALIVAQALSRRFGTLAPHQRPSATPPRTGSGRPGHPRPGATLAALASTRRSPPTAGPSRCRAARSGWRTRSTAPPGRPVRSETSPLGAAGRRGRAVDELHRPRAAAPVGGDGPHQRQPGHGCHKRTPIVAGRLRRGHHRRRLSDGLAAGARGRPPPSRAHGPGRRHRTRALEERIGDAIGVEARGSRATLGGLYQPCQATRRGVAPGDLRRGLPPARRARRRPGAGHPAPRHGPHRAPQVQPGWRTSLLGRRPGDRRGRPAHLPCPTSSAASTGAASIIASAYNKVNGDWCGGHHHLLTEVLEGRLGT